MFEQSTLTNGPAGRRLWTSFAGLTCQAAVIGVAVLLPMVYPQAMPVARFWETGLPPVPPGPKPPDPKVPQTERRVRVSRVAWTPLGQYEPVRIPKGVPTLVDEPPAAQGSVVGAPWTPSGDEGNVLRTLVGDATRVEPPRPVATPLRPPETPATLQRFRIGGNVRLGPLLHKESPQYPPLAKSAHLSGAVTLECVVGADGRMKEVKVVSGNPLLVRAAMDAAWRWVYGPSRLNDEPIEIVTVLTFNFTLN